MASTEGTSGQVLTTAGWEADLKGKMPIAFNPDGMTVRQLKDCAQTLRDVFLAMDRGVDAENIGYHLEGARRQMLKKYGEAQ